MPTQPTPKREHPWAEALGVLLGLAVFIGIPLLALIAWKLSP